MTPFASIGPDVIAMTIPIMAVLGGILIAIVAIVAKSRTKDLEHRERITAMEKGISLPDAPVEMPRSAYASRRASGLVLTGIGLALWIAMSVSEGAEDGIWGLIPFMIGIGLLIASVLDKREHAQALLRTEEMERRRSQSRQTSTNAGASDTSGHDDTDPYA